MGTPLKASKSGSEYQTMLRPFLSSLSFRNDCYPSESDDDASVDMLDSPPGFVSNNTELYRENGCVAIRRVDSLQTHFDVSELEIEKVSAEKCPSVDNDDALQGRAKEYSSQESTEQPPLALPPRRLMNTWSQNTHRTDGRKAGENLQDPIGIQTVKARERGRRPLRSVSFKETVQVVSNDDMPESMEPKLFPVGKSDYSFLLEASGSGNSDLEQNISGRRVNDSWASSSHGDEFKIIRRHRNTVS